MPCGWGVKAGMVRMWVAGKTVCAYCVHVISRLPHIALEKVKIKRTHLKVHHSEVFRIDCVTPLKTVAVPLDCVIYFIALFFIL